MPWLPLAQERTVPNMHLDPIPIVDTVILIFIYIEKLWMDKEQTLAAAHDLSSM